ncbi:MAG TPA: diguanylate cyclase, partial [Longimicrobiaceae bacterium]
MLASALGTAALGVPPVPAPDALARLATFAERILEVPVSIITLSEGRAYCGRAAHDPRWRARREAPLSRTLCRFPAAWGRPLVVEDARKHPAVVENPVLWLGEVGYAGVPIRAADGSVAGSFCAIDTRPRAWRDDEVKALDDLANMAGALLARPDAGIGAAEAGFVGALAGSRGRLSLRMLEKAVETMQIGVTITDADGRILYSNPAEARMHGYTVEELRGRHARIFAPPEHHRPLTRDELDGVTSWVRETVNVRKDGSRFPVHLRSDVVKDSRGQVVGLVTCCEDISARREMERQLLRSAFYDAVTELPNRGLFVHRLERAVDRERRGEADFAVIAVGLDRFQLVGDSLGREAADELLRGVARRLRECMRTDAMVAHVARDEFAVLLDEIDGIAEPTRVAACLQDSLSSPFDVAGTEVCTGCSVGIALSYTGYERAEDVLRDAAIAVGRSRDARQGQYEVFDREMHARSIARLRLE